MASFPEKNELTDWVQTRVDVSEAVSPRRIWPTLVGLDIIGLKQMVLARREGQCVYYIANRCCLDACTWRLIEPFIGGKNDSCEGPR